MAVLKRGSKGSDVKRLQQILIERGYSLAPYGADGDFGSKTTRAVEQFQAAEGLGVDGIVASKTWAALETDPKESQREEATLSSEQDQLRALARAHTDDPFRLAVCDTLIGYLDVYEDPAGSNDAPGLRSILRPDGVSYYDAVGVDRTKYPDEPPWCVTFAVGGVRLGLGVTSWAHTPFGKWQGSTGYLAEWAKDNHCYYDAQDGSFKPLPGDLFVMDRSGSGSDVSKSTKAGHTGTVLAPVGDAIHGIDGNVSNKVDDRQRERSTLGGFVRWRDLL